MRTFELATVDGLRLEARWDLANDPIGTVVLCHPHPLHGGTMTAPLMGTLAEVLVEHRLSVLRFNFRGVGRSEGSHGGGEPELLDIDAATTAASAAYEDLPSALSGWSFGAATALRWSAARNSTRPYVGIAPPVRSELTPLLPAPDELEPARRSFVIGERDQFVEVADLEAYARSIGATVHVIAGSDHFFYFRERRVAELAAADLTAAMGEPPVGGLR